MRSAAPEPMRHSNLSAEKFLTVREMVKLFSEGPLGKGMIPYLLNSVVVVTDKNGPQLKTCQAFTQLKPLLFLRTRGSQAV